MRHTRSTALFCIAALAIAALAAATPDDLLARVRIGSGGQAVVSQFLDSATASKLTAPLSVWLAAPGGEREVASQYDRRADGSALVTWFRASTGHAEEYRLRLRGPRQPAPLRIEVHRGPGALTVATGAVVVRHDLHAGGLPVAFRLSDAGPERPLRWGDRLYSPDLGTYPLSDDRSPRITVEAQGPLRVEICVRAAYRRGDEPAPGNPYAEYRFAYTAGSRSVELSMRLVGPDKPVWAEAHTVELSGVPIRSFYAEAAANPLSLTGRNEPVYSPTALLGTGPEASFGLVQDLVEVTGIDEYVAFWDPALPKTETERAGLVPTYVRGPWLGGWHGDWHHRLSILFGAANMSRDEARAAITPLVSPAPRRVTTLAVEQATSAVGGMGPAANGPADWWWAAYRRSSLLRRADDLAALAASGALQEASAAASGLAREAIAPTEPGPRLDRGSTPRAWVARPPGLIALGSSRCATAVRLDGGPILASLVRRGGQDLARPEDGVPLLRARLRLPDGSEFETDGAHAAATIERAAASPDGAVASVGVHIEPRPGVRVSATVTCALAPDGDQTRWRATVGVEGASLLWVRCPDLAVAPIGGTAALSDQVAITPRALGSNVIERPFESPALGERAPFGDPWTQSTMVYPNMTMPVQMTCLYRRGAGDRSDLLYLATADGQGNYKAFQYVSSRGPHDEARLRAGFVHVPEGPGTATTYTLPYDTVLAPLAGDWFDAAMHYRVWAIRQRWCARGPMKTRADRPAWVKDVPIWYLASDMGDDHVEALAKNADLLGVPVAAHWYDWHHNPFDTRMPDYFPPLRGEEAFRAHVDTWHRHAVRSVPYIQGVLWDELTDSWKREGADRWAVAGPDGKIDYWTSFAGEAKEGHCASMCLATGFWQDKLEQIVRRLASYGVDGVYLDSIGCGTELCYSPNHGHPAGPGGHYWADGVNRLLARLKAIRARSGDRMIFTTEGFTETGIGSFDAFLPHLHHPRPDQGAVYDAIYHDYVSFYGCYTSGAYQPDGTLSEAAARCFALGRPLGWFYHGFHNDMYLTPEARPEMDFVRRLCQVRTKLSGFLSTGQMLAPPGVVVLGADPTVLASAWEGDGARLVVAVNYADHPVRLRLDLARLPDASRLRPIALPGGNASPPLPAAGQELVLGPRAIAAWTTK